MAKSAMEEDYGDDYEREKDDDDEEKEPYEDSICFFFADLVSPRFRDRVVGAVEKVWRRNLCVGSHFCL